MAESAVKSAADLLGKILIEEGKYLWGAEGKIEDLRDELLWMQSFLREADTVQHKDESVRMWVSKIKEHVSEAEDIIDDFVIKVASRRRQNGLLNKLKRYSCIARELYDLHNAASSIDSLKDKIATLSPKLEKYGLKRSLGITTDRAQETLTEQVQQSLKYAYIEDKKIVGLERNAEEIISALKSTTPNRGFHAIYGMGGLGKTTLAIKVCQNDGIKQHFSGGQAFVSVSKQLQDQSVLQDVLKSLGHESKKSLSRGELVSGIHEVLAKKKCLIVLDDVWTQQAWDVLKPAFTSCGGDSGSKLLLTTRKEEVAKYVDPMALHKPDPLNHDESWELLQKTMGWESKDRMEIAGSNEDSEKRELAEKMIKVCDGLPLAIVVLGGILRKKQTLAEWQSVHNNISSHLRMGYDHGRSCMEILLLSYDDLPYHLKPCFLHLANFPEDYKIKTEVLYWMWVAQGLVTRSSDSTTCAKSLEEIANDYLIDLAQVGLVEIVKKTSEGWIESVRMHDLVRDVCIEKAAVDDDSLKVIDLRPGLDEQQINTSDYYSSKRLLQLSIYLPLESVGSSLPDSLLSKAHKYLRSLLFIAEGSYFDENLNACQPWMAKMCNELRMLRVLVLKKTNLKGRLTSQVGNLLHLRFLSLKSTEVSELPSSIGKLRFLEILDLRVQESLIIPNTVGKLFRLRHLLLPEDGYEIKRSKKLRIDGLILLEKIENFQLKNHQTKDLLKIKNLTKLSIKYGEYVSEEEISDIIPAIKAGYFANCLVSGDVISKSPKILSSFACKLELEIVGVIPHPGIENVEFPRYLKQLELKDCELEDDPMRILGSMCHLKSLWLYRKSYVGKTLSCHSNSFPVLTTFGIWELDMLEVLELEHGSMPKLELLPISRSYSDDETKLDGSVIQTVTPYGGEWLKDAVLKEEYDKVVLWGKGGAGKEDRAMELYNTRAVNRHFDAIARICVPSRSTSDSALLPLHTLKRLLRDLNPSTLEYYFECLDCEILIAQIQKVMQEKKCLVILENVDRFEDLDNTFGIGRHDEGFKSKLVITTTCDEYAAVHVDCQRVKVFKLCNPTNLDTWGMLWRIDRLFDKSNAGIKWNMLRHCWGHPLSVKLVVASQKMTKNFTEWATKHEKLTDSSPMTFSQIFAMCYNDLPLHLRSCLIYLANFPEDVDISIKKLYNMWIAAGFVRSKRDDEVIQTEEYLQNLTKSYLTELLERGMITVVKEEETERELTCRLKLALRDLCLEKAKEEHILTVVDQLERSTSTTNPQLKTQQLAVHLDQISLTPASLDEQLSSFGFVSSPTSLLIFSDINAPSYNEEKWEWLIYICKYFQLLRVLDIERMWMTKGSLPKEVGNLRQLRYLSMRGTWVSELPPSIENLINLRTLDLRVMESIIIPDVLWKLKCLIHLYLPDHFIAHETAELRLRGLKCLETLVNLDTDKVCLNDLVELQLLKKISIRKIHAVDELDNILKLLSKSLGVSISSEIINANPTILSSFKNLNKMKIKGMISVELSCESFPTQLEELALKHTMLDEDALPVLEQLLELQTLLFDHESFIGKNMTFSKAFFGRTILTLHSLSNLKKLYLPFSRVERMCGEMMGRVGILDCKRLTVQYEGQQ